MMSMQTVRLAGQSTGTLFASLVFCTLLSTPAHAQLPHAPSDGEIAMMPPFCQVRIKPESRSKPEAERYFRQFGQEAWSHLHHYCYGINFVGRARMTTDPGHRRHYLQSAVGEFRYVLDRVPKNYWMRPQLNLELADVLLQIDRGSEAAQLLYEALAANPRYLQAYLALIRYHNRIGDKAGVLRTATEGLRYLPDSNVLKKHYLDSGGTEPFPKSVPVQPRPESARSEPARSAPRTERSAQQATTAPSRQTEAVAAERAEDPVSTSSESLDEPRERSGGSCRFCPPEEIEQRWRETFQ